MTEHCSTVFLIDDDPAVLKALSRIVALAGFNVEPFPSADLFLRGHDDQTPGCAVVDLSMPGTDGLVLQQVLIELHIDRPIIFLTACGSVPAAVQAMKAGALDFLTKPVDDSVLLAAIARGVEKDVVNRTHRAELETYRHLYATLTAREKEVMRLVSAGRLNKQIAADLGISEKTVEVHRAHVMEKIGARSVAALVRITDRLDDATLSG